MNETMNGYKQLREMTVPRWAGVLIDKLEAEHEAVCRLSAQRDSEMNAIRMKLRKTLNDLRLIAAISDDDGVIDVCVAAIEAARSDENTPIIDAVTAERDALLDTIRYAWDELTQAKQSPTTQDVAECIDRARDAIAKCINN